MAATHARARYSMSKCDEWVILADIDVRSATSPSTEGSRERSTELNAYESKIPRIMSRLIASWRMMDETSHVEAGDGYRERALKSVVASDYK